MRPSTLTEMNLSSLEQEEYEAELKQRRNFPANGSVATCLPTDYRMRAVEAWMEPLDRFAQNIFFVQIDSFWICGRKLLSDLHEAGAMLELHCSRLRASHILGAIESFHVSEASVHLSFYPFTEPEKRTVMQELSRNSALEITYPFSYIASGLERTSPSTGWSLDPERATNLGVGEKNLREHAASVIMRTASACAVVYDPACSTGEFLALVKQVAPYVHTVGQDLSAEMVEYAKSFIDEAHHGDALKPALANYSADYVVCRFLNSEVVTTDQARALLSRLKNIVKVGGRIIVYGHTPVLIRASEIVGSSDFSIEQANASAQDGTEVFQFYVARRQR